MEAAQVIKVMNQMPYGLYIVGSAADGDVNGMMADWVMQVSFEPRLLAVSFENDAHTLENIQTSRMFTVNLLSQAEHSMEIASKFAQPYYGAKVKGRAGAVATEIHHKLEGVQYTTTASGCPVLGAAMGWLECRAEEFVPAGDHTIVIGAVVDGRLIRDAEPLTSSYTGWNYSG